jgi:hypothetical protein
MVSCMLPVAEEPTPGLTQSHQDPTLRLPPLGRTPARCSREPIPRAI